MRGPSHLTAPFPKRESAPARTSISGLAAARARSAPPEVPPCYVMLSGVPRSEASLLPASTPAFSSRSPLACPERRGVARHCTKYRYTCRTKNTASAAGSAKLPNLIDTLLAPVQDANSARCSAMLHRVTCREQSERSRRLPAPEPCYVVLRAAPATRISRHLCRDIVRVSPIPSPKPPKYLGTFSDIRSAVYVPHAFAGPGCLSRAEQRLPAEAGERGTALQKGALSISSITIRQTAPNHNLGVC